MSIESVLARIADLEDAFSPAAQKPATTTGTSSTDFQSVLGAQTAAPVAATTAAPGTDPASALVRAAEGEVGVTEQPPGSNDSQRIAQYRTATAGAGVGPWCAYFASWCARQAGVPLGEQGQGFGSVSALYDWAQRTGRAIPAGPGVVPKPGDLIVWGGEHVGVVESVDPDGTIHTIEGNSDNMVARRTYGPDGGGATGYVRVAQGAAAPAAGLGATTGLTAQAGLGALTGANGLSALGGLGGLAGLSGLTSTGTGTDPGTLPLLGDPSL